MEYGQVCLRRGEEKDLLRGKTMVFDNEIAWVDEYCTLGAVVNVTDHAGNFIARGFFNGDSKIVVRILTRQEETVDAGFFRKRLNNAWNYRRSLGFNNACRVVFGDSDGLPGLTVDKFDRYLSFQIVCAGMELWKTTLIDLLVELFPQKGFMSATIWRCGRKRDSLC